MDEAAAGGPGLFGGPPAGGPLGSRPSLAWQADPAALGGERSGGPGEPDRAEAGGGGTASANENPYADWGGMYAQASATLEQAGRRGGGRLGSAAGHAGPPAGWGGMYGPASRAPRGLQPRRRRTGLSVLAIVLSTALVMALVHFVWDLATPDRLDVPVPQNVAVQANGLPKGFEYAGSASGRGDELICGPISWETVGEVPPGGASAVQEAIDLMSAMTGLSVRPASQVKGAAVRITFEFVSEDEIARAAQGGVGETIGLAITVHGAFGIAGSEILLNEPYFEAALSVGSDDAVLVVLHELGHALGLGHSQDPESLMYPTLSERTRITDADVVAFNVAAPDC